jgi:major vault protein
LNLRQYTIIHDFVDPATGKNALGKRKLIRGEISFFLKPGESMPLGIQSVYILQDDEALVLRSLEEFVDTFTTKINSASNKLVQGSAASGAVQRRPGDKWMIHGPTEFVPPIEVEVVAHRRAIPLDENEGVYIRDVSNGSVRAVIGKTTMLRENEEVSVFLCLNFFSSLR